MHRAGNRPGLNFLYACCLDMRLALVQMADLSHAVHVDRTKMHVTPRKAFAEALMRALIAHLLRAYLATPGPSSPEAPGDSTGACTGVDSGTVAPLRSALSPAH